MWSVFDGEQGSSFFGVVQSTALEGNSLPNGPQGGGRRNCFEVNLLSRHHDSAWCAAVLPSFEPRPLFLPRIWRQRPMEQ